MSDRKNTNEKGSISNEDILLAINSFKIEISETIDDVLSAINSFSTRVDERMDVLDGDTKDVNNDISEMRTDLNKVQSQMVTKDYLDKRVSEMKGESISLVRKEDAKLATTIELLKKKEILSEQEQNVLLRMEPFPKLIP